MGHQATGFDLTPLIQAPTLQAIVVGFVIVFFGFRLLTKLTADHPLSPYAIQIFALIVILPTILVLALTVKFPMEALTGILGTIVGFFFGGAQGRPGSQRENRAGRAAVPRGGSSNGS